VNITEEMFDLIKSAGTYEDFKQKLGKEKKRVVAFDSWTDADAVAEFRRQRPDIAKDFDDADLELFLAKQNMKANSIMLEAMMLLSKFTKAALKGRSEGKPFAEDRRGNREVLQAEQAKALAGGGPTPT